MTVHVCHRWFLHGSPDWLTERLTTPRWTAQARSLKSWQKNAARVNCSQNAVSCLLAVWVHFCLGVVVLRHLCFDDRPHQGLSHHRGCTVSSSSWGQVVEACIKVFWSWQFLGLGRSASVLKREQLCWFIFDFNNSGTPWWWRHRKLNMVRTSGGFRPKCPMDHKERKGGGRFAAWKAKKIAVERKEKLLFMAQ